MLFLQEQIKDIIIIVHNGASPAHRLRITILTGLLDRVTSTWRRLSRRRREDEEEEEEEDEEDEEEEDRQDV